MSKDYSNEFIETGLVTRLSSKGLEESQFFKYSTQLL